MSVLVVLFKIHCSNMIVVILIRCRGEVEGLGDDVLLQVWSYLCPCPRPTFPHGH